MNKMTENWQNEWFIDKKIQQAQYMNKVNEAWIPYYVKDLCRYIASRATWDHTDPKVPSYQGTTVSIDTMEIQMNRDEKYIKRAKKKAIELGWLVVYNRYGTSCVTFPRIGIDDPEIQHREKRGGWEGFGVPKEDK